jgi:hypothetical protein
MSTVDYVPEGHAFGDDEMVFHASGGVPSGDELAFIDLLITGPHASARFPAELEPFVDDRFTKRLQFDFTDVSTSPVARSWAAHDPSVVYVENPQPRLVRDANRPRPDDLKASLREAFGRLARAETERPSLAGVDAIRPVTFAYLPVLRPPADDGELDALVEALIDAGSRGVDRYEALRDDLFDRIIAAKLRALESVDVDALDHDQRVALHRLDLLSIHDTMNHTARPNGAIEVERQPVDRLPPVVALSNRGDTNGDALDVDPFEPVSMAGDRIRAIADAYRVALGADGDDDVVFNRPYLGGHETTQAGQRLNAMYSDPARAHGLDQLSLGAYQAEFLREFLLGDVATGQLMQPGDGWVMPPDDRVEWLASCLASAHIALRAAG